jgi:hypothetical protein
MVPEDHLEANGNGEADPDADLIPDPVDEVVDESFPASDPPATWAGEDDDRVGPAGPTSTVIPGEIHHHPRPSPGE